VKRARFEPVPQPEPDPTPAQRTGSGTGSTLLLSALALAAALGAARLHPTARQVEATAAGVGLVWLRATPWGRRLAERSGVSTARQWLLGLWAVALLAGWTVGYLVVGAVAVCPVLLWGASRGARARMAQRTEVVNSDPPVSDPLETRWQSAATRSGLVHPVGPAAGQPLELVGPPEPNGVGGQVLTADLPPGITPEGVARRTDDLRRWLHVPWLFVRPEGGDIAVMDRVELHCYNRRPLASRPVPWQKLGEYYVPGVQAIPYALNVYGDPLHLDGRLCTLIVAETGAGKTCVQLALLAASALARLPVQVHLADNRSDGDLELSALAGAAAGYARSAPEVWWQVHLLEREIAHRRDAGLSADNAVFAASSRFPWVHLAVAELLTALGSQPPREPLDGMTWPEFTGDRFEVRPPVKEWRAMIADALGGIAREGRSVGVSWSAGTQAGQLDAVEGMARVRRYVAQNIVLRVRHGADVDPALGSGALAGGATAHELPPDVPGLLYVRPDGLSVVHGRAAWVPPAEIKDVAALLRAAQMDHGLWSSREGTTR
jgi:hypothetical protein